MKLQIFHATCADIIKQDLANRITEEYGLNPDDEVTIEISTKIKQAQDTIDSLPNRGTLKNDPPQKMLIKRIA